MSPVSRRSSASSSPVGSEAACGSVRSVSIRRIHSLISASAGWVVSTASRFTASTMRVGVEQTCTDGAGGADTTVVEGDQDHVALAAIRKPGRIRHAAVGVTRIRVGRPKFFAQLYGGAEQRMVEEVLADRQ